MVAKAGEIDLDEYEAKLASQDWEGPTVKFRGVSYQFGSDIPVHALVAMEKGTGNSVGFLADLVVPEQRDDFETALLDEDKPVSSLVLRKLSESVVEAYGKRPT